MSCHAKGNGLCGKAAAGVGGDAGWLAPSRAETCKTHLPL